MLLRFFSARYIYGERSADSGSPATPFIAIPAQSDRVYSTCNKCCQVYCTVTRRVSMPQKCQQVLKVRRIYLKRDQMFFP